MDTALQTVPASLPGIYSNNYPPEYEQYASSFGANLESIGWSWWDTQTYVSAATLNLTRFFSATRALDLCNMEVAGQLAAPKAFLMRAIRFYVRQRPRSVARAAAASAQTGALDNIAQLVNTGVLQFSVGSKVYSQVPLWMLTAGGGPSGVASGEGATADPGAQSDYAQCGIADPRAVFTLSKPIFIKPQMNFQVDLFWPAALTLAGGDTALQVVLDGDLLRSVQ